MKETTKFGNGTVHLTTLNAKEYKELGSPKATSVHAFPIKREGQDLLILFTLNARGIDIIGGHVEGVETSEEALIRENLEEACIVITEYCLLGAIEVDNRDNPEAIAKGYPEKGYQLFYVIPNYIEKEFQETHECIGRKYLYPEEIKDNHHNWLQSHQNILDMLTTPKEKKEMWLRFL